MTTAADRRAARTPDVDEPRERILSAAGQEFAERGYEAATVRDICLAAGVNVAAVNYYFGDKERLYIESVKHAHRERVREVPLPELPPGTPSEIQLAVFVRNMLERMLGFGRPPWQARLMLREVVQPTDACRELVEDYIRPHFEMLGRIIASLADGRLTEAEVRRVSLSIVGQCFLYRVAGDVVGMLVPEGELRSMHTPQALADHVTSYALAALGKGAPLARPSEAPAAP